MHGQMLSDDRLEQGLIFSCKDAKMRKNKLSRGILS